MRFFVTTGLTAAVLGAPGIASAQHVVMETSMGTIELELDAQKAPKTVANFLRYVREGFYDGLIFHRVIKGFMIQGGGFDAKMRRKPTHEPIPLETGRGLSNLRGTIAMARTNDPNSATSQFFINHVDNKRLDTYGGGYAVFGRVVKGMDVVDRIAAVPTHAVGGHQNVPVTPVIIQKVRVIETGGKR